MHLVSMVLPETVRVLGGLLVGVNIHIVAINFYVDANCLVHGVLAKKLRNIIVVRIPYM